MTLVLAFAAVLVAALSLALAGVVIYLPLLVVAALPRTAATNRIRWFYGYRLGVYWVDWRLKARRAARAGTRGRCGAGHWTHRQDGTMVGWACSKPALHLFRHRHTADVRPIR